MRFPVAGARVDMKLHVLVVDTDPDARAVYRILFARQRVTLVGELAAARAALETVRYDVVIADWTLPDGNAADVLRNLPRGVHAPLRLLHAASRLPEIEAAYIDRMADWLFEKPSWFDLLQQIKRLAPMVDVTPRRAVRHALRLHAFLRSAAWKGPRRMSTVNLSEHGLAFTCSEPLAPGEAIRVALAVPGGGRLHLVAVIRHSTPLRSGSPAPWLVGAEICKLAFDERRALMELLGKR